MISYIEFILFWAFSYITWSVCGKISLEYFISDTPPQAGRGIYQLKDYGVQPPYAPASDTRWTLNRFKRDLRIEIISSNDTELEFDMININAALANTLRRILLVDVPSMAIEKVRV